MMEHGWVAIAIATTLVAVSLPAGADFHPDCDPQAAAYANTDLRAVEGDDGPQLQYRGLVYCPDAAVDIHDVRVSSVDGQALAHTANEGCQATATDPCTASDTVDDPGEGFYEVNMTFSTPCCPNVERLQQFYWPGQGQPVPVCVNAGLVPVPPQPGCAGLD